MSRCSFVGSCALFLAFWLMSAAPVRGTETETLWQLAKRHAAGHRFSTLLTAQDVRDRLSSSEGLQRAMDWCKQTGVSKVYIESFRDGYQADRATLEHAREAFRRAGFIASGCVTPTKVGKKVLMRIPLRRQRATSCRVSETTSGSSPKAFL